MERIWPSISSMLNGSSPGSGRRTENAGLTASTREMSKLPEEETPYRRVNFKRLDLPTDLVGEKRATLRVSPLSAGETTRDRYLRKPRFHLFC